MGAIKRVTLERRDVAHAEQNSKTLTSTLRHRSNSGSADIQKSHLPPLRPPRRVCHDEGYRRKRIVRRRCTTHPQRSQHSRSGERDKVYAAIAMAPSPLARVIDLDAHLLIPTAKGIAMMDESTRSDAVPTVRIAGFHTARLTRSQLAQLMVEDVLHARAKGKEWAPKLVFSSNGQGIALSREDPEFKSTMKAADIIHADGMPLVLASKVTKQRLPERIATTDFFHDAARAASRKGLRFFFLGASEQQNEAAVARVRHMYPNLEIAGRHHGYFDAHETSEIYSQILDARTDVLWVALGKPRQETWCLEARANLPGVGWLKTCGGLFAFLAGDAPRAPRWMQYLRA